MRSSTAAPASPSALLQRTPVRSGGSPLRITAPAFRPRSTTASGASSRRWSRATRSRAPASGFRSSRSSSKHRAAASGWSRSPGQAPRSLSHGRKAAEHPARRRRPGRRHERAPRVPAQPHRQSTLRRRRRRGRAATAPRRQRAERSALDPARSQHASHERDRVSPRGAPRSAPAAHAGRGPHDLERRTRQDRGLQPERRRLHPEARHVRQLRRSDGRAEQVLEPRRAALIMSRLQLLIVDDDDVDRRAIRRALRDARVDAEIDEAPTAAAAVEAVRARHYDCIFLDHYLPGSTGLEALAQIRALGAQVPVVSLTGQGDENLAVELMKAGAADYLNKAGLTPDRLGRSLRYALALHHSEVERQALLEREQQERREAQRANRAKDEFLATLSHELRTPLNAILGWTSLLGSGQLDPRATRKAIEIIDRNTRVQAQLIEDLLDISRIVTGKLRLEIKSVALRSIVQGAIDAVRHAADAKGVRLEADAADATVIQCDAARMQQVIWNLLTNAIKFTPQGGQVRIATQRDGHRVQIMVTDSGAGISPEFLPYVFDRFRQEDGAATREHAGLGIGLSIVRHVVEQHGGTVTAHSAGEGTGASFTVELPVHAVANGNEPTVAIVAPPAERAVN